MCTERGVMMGRFGCTGEGVLVGGVPVPAWNLPRESAGYTEALSDKKCTHVHVEAVASLSVILKKCGQAPVSVTAGIDAKACWRLHQSPG